MRVRRQYLNLDLNLKLLFGSLLVWLLGWLFQRNVLHFNPLLPSHDAKFYFYSSERWHQMLEPFHVPLYPLLLRLFRWISGNTLEPLFYTQALNLLFFLASIQVFYLIAKEMDLKRTGATRMSWVFALFLFTGFSYALTPIADQLTIFLYLTFLLSIIRKGWWQAVVLASICLLSHKIAWPMVAFTFAGLLWTQKENRLKWLLAAFVSLTPLIAYWLYGAQYHEDSLWLLSANLDKEIQSEGIWYPFIGMINLAFSGSGIDWIKFVSIFLLLVGAGVGLSRINPSEKKVILGLPAFLSLLLFTIVLNDFELFVILRYGKLLLLCALGWLRPDWLIRPFWWTLVIVLFLSNLVFMWQAAGTPKLF